MSTNGTFAVIELARVGNPQNFHKNLWVRHFRGFLWVSDFVGFCGLFCGFFRGICGFLWVHEKYELVNKNFKEINIFS